MNFCELWPYWKGGFEQPGHGASKLWSIVHLTRYKYIPNSKNRTCTKNEPFAYTKKASDSDSEPSARAETSAGECPGTNVPDTKLPGTKVPGTNYRGRTFHMPNIIQPWTIRARSDARLLLQGHRECVWGYSHTCNSWSALGEEGKEGCQRREGTVRQYPKFCRGGGVNYIINLYVFSKFINTV